MRLTGVIVCLWLAIALVVTNCPNSSASSSTGRQSDSVTRGGFCKLSVDGALNAARRDHKVVMLYFGLPNCAWCRKLDNTFKDCSVQDWLRDMTVALQLDAQKEAWLGAKYRVDRYPTIIFLTPDGSEVSRIEGYLSPKGFLLKAGSLVGGK